MVRSAEQNRSNNNECIYKISNGKAFKIFYGKAATTPLRIAIIGSGISGLAALWALKSTSHEVHLYESQDYFGGHTQTVPWRDADSKRTTNVDIGFTLFNQLTYPNFTAFVDHLNLPVRSLRVTFGLSRNNGTFSWSSTSISALFAQRRNLLSPAFYRMLFDILRFNHSAASVLSPTYPYTHDSISCYLTRNHYSAAFANDYLIPLVSSLWVHDPDETLNSIPVTMLVRYLYNHCMLNSFGKSLEWLVFEDGAKRYVDAIVDDIAIETLHKSTKIESVRSMEGGNLALRLDNGEVEAFDKVIVATHAPDALKLLGDVTPREKEILGRFRTSESTVVLHSDLSFMPQNRSTWSAWNYHDFSPSPTFQSPKISLPPRVSLTANLYTHSHPTNPILTTLNPPHLPAPSKTQGVFHYKHPILDHAAQEAKKIMRDIQGKRGIWWCGAWLGYGFHEDGFSSGIAAARGVEPAVDVGFEMVDWKDEGKEVYEGRGSWVFGILIMLVQGVIVGCVWWSEVVFG